MVEVRNELTDQPPIIRYTGVFDFDKLYKSITKWYKAHGYDMQEKKYVHKGKELEFEWFGDKKITEYYKYEIEVALFIWEFGETEVVKDGQTIKMNKGRIQMVIKGAYVLDYAKSWGSTPAPVKSISDIPNKKFVHYMQDLYHKYIINKDIIFKVYSPLYKLVYGFYDDVRETIGMEHM
ncbi:MAG: hypothetical protein WC471_04460 [Candidatus Woesearchaeota archaeon]|jgi:hypothetical protein